MYVLYKSAFEEGRKTPIVSGWYDHGQVGVDLKSPCIFFATSNSYHVHEPMTCLSE
jgi:hypothetical protein